MLSLAGSRNQRPGSGGLSEIKWLRYGMLIDDGHDSLLDVGGGVGDGACVGGGVGVVI